MLKPHIKTGFYQQYQAEKIPPRPPDSKAKTLWKQILNAIYWTLRVLFYLVLFVLSSVGATALVNEPVRNLLIKILFQ